MTSNFPYKKVLVLGATSGIGKALASKFVANGIAVVAVGRRREYLDEFVQQHGADMASAKVFDITQLDKIPHFASEVTSEHPDIDCVFINSGIQRGFNFNRPETINMASLQEELMTNYTAAVQLTVSFLPHLQRLQQEPHRRPTALMYTTSGLALVPMLRCPNYCATKAALHSFILTLRAQLEEGEGGGGGGGNGGIRVVEIYPPAVQTELHDAKHQPDIKNGHLIGMPLDQFTEETWTKLSQGHDQVPVGTSNIAFDGFEKKRQEIFGEMRKRMAALLKEHVNE